MTTTQPIYRPAAPGETLAGPQLAGAKVAFETAHADPRPANLLFARYYCGNEDCRLREITLRGKWEDGDRPARPKFACPSCGGDLAFQTLLKETILVPVDQEPSLPYFTGRKKSHATSEPEKPRGEVRQFTRIKALRLRGDVVHITVADDAGTEQTAEVPDRATGNYKQMQALLAKAGVAYRELPFEIGRRPDGSPRAWKAYMAGFLDSKE